PRPPCRPCRKPTAARHPRLRAAPRRPRPEGDGPRSCRTPQAPPPHRAHTATRRTPADQRTRPPGSTPGRPCTAPPPAPPPRATAASTRPRRADRRLALDPVAQLPRQLAHPLRLVGQRPGPLQEADAGQLGQHRGDATGPVLVWREAAAPQPPHQHLLVPGRDHRRVTAVRDEGEAGVQATLADDREVALV